MINDDLAEFIRYKKELVSKTDRAIILDADMDKRSFYSYLRREIIKGKPRGVTLSTADRLLKAINSSWSEFAIWLNGRML